MIQCQHCQAMKFRDESKDMCCCNRKANPEPFPPLPQQLAVLFEGTTDQSVRFLQDIRKYNSAFQLTSFGCKEVRMNGWNPQFRIQGKVCHLIGPVEPAFCRISEFPKAYDSFQYPIVFPHGSDRWNLIMKITGQHKVTQLQFCCFHLFTRQGNYLLPARRLLQQVMVEAYAKIECERPQYIRREQKRLRADNYQDLRDTIVNSDGNTNNVGQRVILPSSYYGGPRFMFEKQQDARSYVRKFGRPDLFIAITTNPNWEEITRNLLLDNARMTALN